jgi:hypothetical protein
MVSDGWCWFENELELVETDAENTEVEVQRMREPEIGFDRGLRGKCQDWVEGAWGTEETAPGNWGSEWSFTQWEWDTFERVNNFDRSSKVMDMNGKKCREME